ncbi:MAG: SIS domain-containing protein, partial [Mesorhizobium sp.]
GEILVALVAGKGGDKALAAIRRTEDQLSQLDIHILPPRGRRKS